MTQLSLKLKLGALISALGMIVSCASEAPTAISGKDQAQSMEDAHAPSSGNKIPTTPEEIADARAPVGDKVMPKDIAENPDGPIMLPTDAEMAASFTGPQLAVKNMHEIRYTYARLTGIGVAEQPRSVRDALEGSMSLFPKTNNPAETTGSFLSAAHKTANAYADELCKSNDFADDRDAIFGGQFSFDDEADVLNVSKAATASMAALKHFWGTVDSNQHAAVLNSANALLGNNPGEDEALNWCVGIVHQALTSPYVLFH